MRIIRDQQGVERIIVGAAEVRASVLYAMSTVMAFDDIADAYPDLGLEQIADALALYVRAEQHVGVGADLAAIELAAVALLREEK